MAKIPSWQIEGVLTDIGERKTKSGEVWMHEAKLLALGGTFKIQSKDKAVFGGVGEGENVLAVGRFELSGNYTNLIVTGVKKAS